MISADLVRGVVLVPVAIAGLDGSPAALRSSSWPRSCSRRRRATSTRRTAALLPDARRPTRTCSRRTGSCGRPRMRSRSAAGRSPAPAASCCRSARSSRSTRRRSSSRPCSCSGVRTTGRGRRAGRERPRISEGFAALRPLPVLAAAVVVLGLAVTLSSGTLDRRRAGAGRARRSISAPAASRSSRRHTRSGRSRAVPRWLAGPVRRKARASMLAWALYLPAYGLFAVAGSLPVALAAGCSCGVGQGSSWVLINSAAQEEVPDRLLGRVIGLVSLVHRGAHATGSAARLAALRVSRRRTDVFAAAAIAIPLTGLAGLACQRLEQPKLEHPRRVEAVDPEHRAGRGGGGAGRHQADELRADDRRARARGLLARSARRCRAAPPPPSPRRSCSPGRARRAAARGRARARPGSRRRSRGRPRRSRVRPRARLRRLTLNAISGRRAPTSTPPARRRRSRAGPKSASSSPASIRRCSSSGPPRRKNAGPRPGASSP